MTTPNVDAEAGQLQEQEPEGIRRMREDFGPEKVAEILEGIRQAMDDRANGDYITLEDYLKQRGVTADEVLEAYLEKRGMTGNDIK